MSNGILATASAFIAVCSAALGAYATWQNIGLEKESQRQSIEIELQSARIQEADQKLRVRADNRAETSAEREYVIAVFEKVSTALESSDVKKQQVALALVETLSDAALRERISRAFQIAPETTPEIRVAASQLQDRAAQAVVEQKVLGQGIIEKWAYDVFWCEAGSATNKEIATQIFKELSTQSTSRLRLRSWSKDENAKQGYQISGQQIRAEQSEFPQATKLKNFVFIRTALNIPITRVGNETKNYLTIFICNP